MAETHRTAVYTGSFDPVTLGHQSVIQRSAKLFDEVVVAVGLNVEKQMLFSTDERVELLQSVTDALANVRVTTFDGLAVDYVRSIGSRVMIQRSAKLFDEVVVAVGLNVEKQMLFSTDERVELLQSVTDALANVRVTTFDGLAVDYVRSIGSRVMIRGLRPLTDTAGEFTMMMANRQLDADIETVFLMADESLTHVSSSLIKQIAPLADDQKLARFVPHQVIPAIREKFGLA